MTTVEPQNTAEINTNEDKIKDNITTVEESGVKKDSSPPEGILALIKRRASSDDESKPPGLRRKSTLKGISTSLISALSLRRLTRTSISKEDMPKPKVPMANTYRMEPNGNRTFQPYVLEKPLENLVKLFLRDAKYDPKTCNNLSCRLAQMVGSKVKEFKFERYKFVSNVILGQANNQGLQMASRCVWDCKKDSVVTITYQNNSIFAVVTVHGVYFE